MPVIQRFARATLLMYFDDHAPPHVHVKLREGRECTVELDGLVIKGQVEAREIREVLAWIEANATFLREQWHRCNP